MGYTVYKHTSPSGKVYIGITKRKPEYRWNKGKGYRKDQLLFYRAIKKYGWDNFTHEILYTGLSEKVVPNDYTLELGNNTGIKNRSARENQIAWNVPHWRGFNVFWYGDITMVLVLLGLMTGFLKL